MKPGAFAVMRARSTETAPIRNARTSSGAFPQSEEDNTCEMQYLLTPLTKRAQSHAQDAHHSTKQLIVAHYGPSNEATAR